MKKYDSYKDSGVKWIGQIPGEWEILRMKFLFKDISIKNRPELELLSVTQNQGVIPRDMVESRMVMPTGNLESFKVISKGDFAISLRSFEGGLEYSDYEGLISPAYTVLKSQKEIKETYYKYLFKSKSFIGELQYSIVGIREGKNISYEELKYSYIQIPPLPEQQAISQFLDDKTVKIDQLIQIKQKEINLLKERRQILIQKAVTKGLDPTVKLKNSGVDWIGEIPEHWEVTSVKKLLKIPITDGPHTTPQLYDEGIPFISAEAIKNNKIDFSKKRGYISITDHKEFTKKYNPKKNDIYMVKSGATTGNIAMVETDEEFSIWSPLAVFRTNNNRLDARFLFFALQSVYFKKGVELKWSYGTQQNIGMGVLSNLPVIYTSLDEQQTIVEYLERIDSKIAQAIFLKQQEIEKLKEYKTVLIDNVVTGKIKVS